MRGERIASWLQERAAKAGARGFVFGLSGGIDSAVVARLCQMAAPQRVLGVLLPCYSNSQDEDRRAAGRVGVLDPGRARRPRLGVRRDDRRAQPRDQGPADARRRRRHQAAVARSQHQAAAADDVALLHRQRDELSGRWNRQSQRNHDWVLHEVRRRRRRSAADWRVAQERSATRSPANSACRSR